MGFGPRGGGRSAAYNAGDDPAARVPKERRGATIRRIAAFFRPYRWQVLVVLGAILLTSLLGLINPLLLKALIDSAIPSGSWPQLNLFVALMIIVPIVSGLIGVGQSYWNNVVGQHVMQDLRNALYAHLQKMPLRFFAETRTGEIQSRLANDVGGVQSVVTDTASSVVSNMVIAVTTIIVMLFISWQLTLLSLIVLPFFMWLTYRVGKIRRSISTETQETMADVTAITQETLSVSGILLSKTFGQQTASVERFRLANAKLAALQIRQSMVGRWFFMIVGTIFSIMPAFVYWLAGALIFAGVSNAPTIGDIVAFTTLQSRLFFPLGQLLNVHVEVQGALALFDRIFAYLDMEPEITDAADALDLDPSSVRGDVRYRGVSFRYRTTAPVAVTPEAEAPNQTREADEDVEEAIAAAEAGAGAAVEAEAEAARPTSAAQAVALEDPGSPEDEAAAADVEPIAPFGIEGVDFEARAGQLVALVGPSGAGKTTTTYLLPRLYEVDAGAIELDGHDIRTLTLESLGRVIGFVTQETYLFHASVRDNLLYARPDASQAQLEAAGRAAAIHDRIMELPEGYDTIVGERGYKLSGGEKQRVAIARVLLKDPRVLILDEATSALDTVSERLIQAALERAEAGRTTLAIAHRLSTILRADLILVFEGGHIVERGTHHELLGLDGLYARLYHEQFLTAAAVAAEADPAGGVAGAGREASVPLGQG
ncbi:MAG TPA: ABC transporter ATP-binding protein [Candidatus Limnocylindrales bacterium]|jgi:ATP-binding cassette subfamily B protein